MPPDGVEYLGFGEMPKNFTHKNCITIPAGNYFFRHDVRSQIENAHEIFKEQIKGKDAFTVIETEEMFLSKTKASQVIYFLTFPKTCLFCMRLYILHHLFH